VFSEPDFRGGHRVDAIPEGRGGRIIVMVNTPITPLEPPVDGRRETKTQWQERKDGSNQSIVREHGIAVVVVVVAGSHHQSGLFAGACWRIHSGTGCCTAGGTVPVAGDDAHHGLVEDFVSIHE
jgi:hypothetical protein